MIAGLLLAAAQPATLDRPAVEAIVREYLQAHPELLKPAKADTSPATDFAAVATPYANAWEGAADADVTLVEFFDYHCGYCRRSVADVARLLREDPKLRVVYRELPVLSAESEAAARVALVAARGPRYAELHRALYAAEDLDAKVLAKLAASFGIDPALTRSPAIDAELAANHALMEPLDIGGTPTWVIGDRVIAGAVGYDALKAAIAEARKGTSGR